MNPYQDILKNNWDAFITKINPGGNDLEFSTYLGGGWYDYGKCLALDYRDRVIVAGQTSSGTFPLKNPFQDTLYGGQYRNDPDGFVTKFSTAGNTLKYSTFLGSGNYDLVKGIAVDSLGHAYVIGYTSNKLEPGFPLENPLQENYAGGSYDTFVTKLADDYPPKVSIISPENGAVLSVVVTIRAEAEDDVGIDRIYFYIDDELHQCDKTEPYEYDWESFRSVNGRHTIKAEAVDTEEHRVAAEIKVTTKNLVLKLQVERKEVGAWLIKRDYGKIDFSLKNPGSLFVKRYIIYRKKSGEDFQPLLEIPGSHPEGDIYTYLDKYLEKDKLYTYKCVAQDAAGATIAESAEIII